MAIDEDSDEWSEVKWEIEAYLDRHANLSAAEGHSYMGDQDLIDLEEERYEDESAFKTAQFGDAYAVNSDILVDPYWYDELGLKKPKRGAELWREATTRDGQYNAAYAFEAWLTENGYEVVDRLSGDWPGGVEAEIQIDHLLRYVAEDQEVSEEDVDRVLRAEFSGSIMHDNVYWSSSSGEIEMFAKPIPKSLVELVDEDPTQWAPVAEIGDPPGYGGVVYRISDTDQYGLIYMQGLGPPKAPWNFSEVALYVVDDVVDPAIEDYDIRGAARSRGEDPQTLFNAIESKDPVATAMVWEAIGGYEGWENVDPSGPRDVLDVDEVWSAAAEDINATRGYATSNKKLKKKLLR